MKKLVGIDAMVASKHLEFIGNTDCICVKARRSEQDEAYVLNPHVLSMHDLRDHVTSKKPCRRSRIQRIPQEQEKNGFLQPSGVVVCTEVAIDAMRCQ
jgi:hypothetical protein